MFPFCGKKKKSYQSWADTFSPRFHLNLKLVFLVTKQSTPPFHPAESFHPGMASPSPQSPGSLQEAMFTLWLYWGWLHSQTDNRKSRHPSSGLPRTLTQPKIHMVNMTSAIYSSVFYSEDSHLILLLKFIALSCRIVNRVSKNNYLTSVSFWVRKFSSCHQDFSSLLEIQSVLWDSFEFDWGRF